MIWTLLFSYGATQVSYTDPALWEIKPADLYAYVQGDASNMTYVRHTEPYYFPLGYWIVKE